MQAIHVLFSRALSPAALTSAGLSLGAAGLYAVAVGTAAGRRLDGEAYLLVSDGRLEPVAEALVHALNPFSAVAAGIVLLLAAHRRGRRAAIAVTVLLIASNAGAWVLEAALGEVDPLGGERLRELGPAYYPSGHATAAMSLALAAVLAAPPALRSAVAAAGAGLSALFGCAVVASGAHTPSDVVGAFLLAGAWAALAALISRGDFPTSRGDSSREATHPGDTITGGDLESPSSMSRIRVLHRSRRPPRQEPNGPGGARRDNGVRRAMMRARWLVVPALAAVAVLAIAPGAQPQTTPAQGSTWTSVVSVGTSEATIDWDSIWPRDHYVAYLYDARGVQLRRARANGPVGNTSSHEWTALGACTDYKAAGSAVVDGVETALSPRTPFRTTGCWGGYSNPWQLPSAGWRPYSDTAAWNRGTVGATVRPDSGVLVDYLRRTASGRMHNIAVPDDTGSSPVYFADADDPQYTISCRQWVSTCEVHGETVRIPARARPTPEHDRHLVSIQPDGTEVDLWEADDPSGTGGTLSVSHGGMTRIDGDSTGSNAVAAATGAMAGQFSSRSWRADRIEHALQLIIPRDSGSHVYPAGKTGASDPATSPVPMGQWFKLAVTDSELALEPPWRRAIYRAMRDYGLFVVDTGASFMIAHENPLTFTAFGAADPAWTWLRGQAGVDEWVDPDTGKLNMVAKTPSFPFDKLVALTPPPGP